MTEAHHAAGEACGVGCSYLTFDLLNSTVDPYARSEA